MDSVMEDYPADTPLSLTSPNFGDSRFSLDESLLTLLAGRLQTAVN